MKKTYSSPTTATLKVCTNTFVLGSFGADGDIGGATGLPKLLQILEDEDELDDSKRRW